MGLLILITCVCLLTLGVPVWTIVSPSSGSATESPKVHLTRTPKSQTVMVNHRFEFFCKAEGDGRMKIRWYVNGTKRENELPKRGENYRTLRNGTLRFNKVKVVDRGIYRCKAENGFKDFVFSEPALLTVHAPAQIVRSAETGKERVWDVGSTRHLECVAAGIPLPRIEWRRDGQLIPAMVGNRTEERTDRGTSVASLKSLLTVQVTRSANYSCTASNFPTSDGIPSTDTVSVRVTAVKMSNEPDNKSPSLQTCRPYTGSFCSKYLGSDYVVTPATPGRSSTADEALVDLDQLLAAHMKDLTRANLFSGRNGYDICMKPARRIICHLAFQTCLVPEPGAGGGGGSATISGRDPGVAVLGTPLPICRESCQAVTEMFCLRQLAQIHRLKEAGQLTGTLGLLGMPDCSTLPSMLDKGHIPGAPACIESDHHDFGPEKVSDTCYVERGRWYNGTVSVTRNGHTCQSWDEVSPHGHNRSALIYPEVKGAANFCRNPGGEEPAPWCYTTNRQIRFELCDVKPCGTETGGDAHRFQMLVVIIGVPCAVVLVIFAVVMFCLCSRRRKYSSAPGEDVDVDVEGLTVNSAYYTPTRLNPKLEAIEFPRNDLLFVERIGQGAFGLVFKARVVCSNGNSRLVGGGGGNGMLGNKLSSSKQSLGFGDSNPGRYKRNPFSSKGELQHIEFHDPLGKISCDSKLLSNDHITNDQQIHGKMENETGGGEGEGQIVAVKMLKEDASESIQTDFEREASLMVEFEHENIVRLLGVCTVGRPLCLLFEYMSHGDLNDYLQLCSPDRCLMRPLPNPASVDSPLPTSIKLKGVSSHCLETADHLHIARQVCSGMVYLSDRGYVHRDLATRNCLVGDHLTVKISDFGLARSVHSMDYYRGSDRDAVPIRWMPPEAILYNKFSSQSDVWSFGVLLWEVFSYAFQPYYGLTHEEVIAALRAGRTLDPPEAAPPAVYSLMKSCWRTKPSTRPSFSSLHKCLLSMHEEACRTKAGIGNVRL